MKNRSRPTDTKNEPPKGTGKGGGGKIGVWDYEIQTTMYKIDKQQGYSV